MRRILFYIFGVILTLLVILVLMSVDREYRLITSVLIPVPLTAIFWGGAMIIDNICDYFGIEEL